MNETKKDDHSVVETLQHAIDGTDEPMEKSHPVATSTLMMGSYPIALVLAILIGLVCFALWPGADPDGERSPAMTSQPNIEQ